MLENYFSIVL